MRRIVTGGWPRLIQTSSRENGSASPHNISMSGAAAKLAETRNRVAPRNRAAQSTLVIDAHPRAVIRAR